MQPLLSSAGRQYGISSLDSDVFELDELAQHLKSFYNAKVRTLAELNCRVVSLQSAQPGPLREELI